MSALPFVVALCVVLGVAWVVARRRTIGLFRISDLGRIIQVDTSLGDMIVSLPSPISGRQYRIVKVGASGNSVTIVTGNLRTVQLAHGDVFQVEYRLMPPDTATDAGER